MWDFGGSQCLFKTNNYMSLPWVSCKLFEPLRFMFRMIEWAEHKIQWLTLGSVPITAKKILMIGSN